MALKELLYRWINEYADELQIARSTEDFKRSLGAHVRQDIAGNIQKQIDGHIYKVKGSVGAGRWTDVPWVAVFDTRITKSAQKGVYIVYLLNKDKKELFLTLNQGATGVAQEGGTSDGKLASTRIASASTDKTTDRLKVQAQAIRSILGKCGGLLDGVISTGSKAYDAGCIYYKKYTLDNIPEDDILFEDLNEFIIQYQKYYEKIFLKKESTGKDVSKMESKEEEKDLEWLPAIGQYSPDITKEQWLQMLNNKKIFTEKNLLAMACIYDSNGEGSCIGLAEKYHQSMTLWRTSCGVHLAARVAEETKCPLMKEDGKTTYFVIPFLYRKAGSDEDGSWIYKLRPELYDALTEFDILRYLPKKEGEKEVAISDKDVIDKIKSYIAAKGFSYPDGLIENFYLSLKSKPFVILAGTSGTGKTRLVRLFSEAIGATAGNGRYKLVSVRPDWSDSSDLFGHVNLKGEFVPGAIIDFVHDASQNTDTPYFLCLDEMNLARVEYYLSDFLSVIETRHRTESRIETDEVILDKAAADKYGKVTLPENLYVIGTVNMDETTFPFSKKVLDRANTIEFSYVDLEPDFEDQEEEVEPLSLKNDFLKTRYLILKADVPVEQRDLAIRVSRELQEINEILLMANAHVGYRVRDEIVFYMINRKMTDILSYDVAMDNEIMQKILPRIQGSSASIERMLCELFKKCAGDYTGLNQGSISEQMEEYINTHECKYRKSAEKISYMMRRYKEDGFTSYWL